jgi:hypothetical protein
MRSFCTFLPLLVIAILALWAPQFLNAQNPGTTALLLCGSNVKVEDAVNRSDIILVGVITDMGKPCQSMDFENAGEIFDHMKINVAKVLWGTVGKQAIATTYVSIVSHEQRPVLGPEFLFLMKRSSDKDEPIRIVKEIVPEEAVDLLETIKILPATSENIAKVKALIAALPAGN